MPKTQIYVLYAVDILCSVPYTIPRGAAYTKRQVVIAPQTRGDAYGYEPTERNLVTSDCVDYHHAAYKQISRPELPFLTAYSLSTYRG